MKQLKLFGFWQEHCQGTFPSMFSQPKITDLNDALFEDLVSYLEGCPIFVASPGIVYSAIDPTKVAGTNSIRTNGEWAWHDTAAHYLKHLHIGPPAEFLAQTIKGGLSIPSESSIDMLNLDLPTGN